MGLLRNFIDRYVLAKDDAQENDCFNDFPVGSLKITTPDGKTTVAMDIVTAADERKAQQLTALLLGGSKYEVVDADSFLGLTD